MAGNPKLVLHQVSMAQGSFASVSFQINLWLLFKNVDQRVDLNVDSHDDPLPENFLTQLPGGCRRGVLTPVSSYL